MIPGVVSSAPYAGVPSGDAVWSDFLQWLRSTPIAGEPDHLLDAYRGTLRSAQVPLFEIERRLESITGRMDDDVDGWRWLFNRVYAAADAALMPANAFLARVTADLSPGTALDVCAGQGRNSLYLAARGWQVTGFDVADHGLDIAARKRKHGDGELRLIRFAEQFFPYGTARWDLVVLAYAPVAITAPSFVAKLRAALRPGGAVVIETFGYDARLGRTRMGPIEVEPRELLQAFEGFSVLAYDDLVTVPDWGSTRNRVLRLFARADRSAAAAHA